MRATISNVLSVPKKFVKKKWLKKFKTTLVNYYGGGEDKLENVEDYDGSLDLIVKGYYYNSIKKTYNFYLGKRELLQKYFGDLDIEDLRADVPMSKYAMKYLDLKEGFSFRDGQKQVVKDWLSVKRGILKCPARFGKTICMGYIVTKLKRKTLIIANQKELLFQWEKEFRERVSNIDDIESNKHPIIGYLKKFSDIDKYDIVLSSWQKWHRNPKKLHKYRNAFGLILIDEIHRCNAECPKDVISQFCAKYKGGVTATVERKDGREVYCEYIVGPVTAEGKTEQMSCKVVPTMTQLEPPTNFNWAKLINAYCGNKKRNKEIVNLAIKQAELGKHIVIGSDRVKHCNKLAKMINKQGVTAEAFHAKSDRKRVLKGALSGKVKVVVAMRSMLTGINIPIWDTFFNILPISNPPSYYQQFSRIRTVIPSKKEAIIFDFIDEAGVCYGAFGKRRKQYEEQGFTVQKRLYLQQTPLEKSNLEHKENVSFWERKRSNMMSNIKPFFVKPTKDGKEVANLFD